MNPNNIVATKPKMQGRKKLALWLLIAPISLFALTCIGFIIIGFITQSTPGTDEGSLLYGLANLLLAMTGLVSVLTMIPGLIIGIILVIQNK
jgi:hypothetical protein